MAIVTGDVVELGLSLPSGDISKVLGVVEGESIDMLQIFTGVPPQPHREVPRASVIRVWAAASAKWGVTDYNQFNVFASGLSSRAEKRKQREVLRSAPEVSDAGLTSEATLRTTKTATANPLRWLCGAIDSLCNWRSPVLTVTALAMLGCMCATQFNSCVSPPTVRSQRTLLSVWWCFLALTLVGTICLSRPSSQPSPLWMYSIVLILVSYYVAPKQVSPFVTMIHTGVFTLKAVLTRRESQEGTS